MLEPRCPLYSSQRLQCPQTMFGYIYKYSSLEVAHAGEWGSGLLLKKASVSGSTFFFFFFFFFNNNDCGVVCVKMTLSSKGFLGFVFDPSKSLAKCLASSPLKEATVQSTFAGLAAKTRSRRPVKLNTKHQASSVLDPCNNRTPYLCGFELASHIVNAKPAPSSRE